MNRIKKYLSLDIETTGLNKEKSLIIQLAARVVNEDLTVSEPFNILINHEEIIGEPFALGLNGWIFKEITSKNCSYKVAHNNLTATIMFDEWINNHFNSKEKITVAGKNAATFDLPFLKHYGFNTGRFSHRVIDVGSMYLENFGYVPNLDEINKLLDRKSVTHNALDDVDDVIYAINNKLKRLL